MAELIVRESNRSPREVIDSLRAHAESFGFVIRNVYDMNAGRWLGSLMRFWRRRLPNAALL